MGRVRKDLVEQTRSLQRMDTDFARALGRLNSLCLTGRWIADTKGAKGADASADASTNPDVAHLRSVCTDASVATSILKAHGRTAWPGSYGQSPYAEVMAVIRHALDGQRLPRGSSQVERDLYGLLVPAIALPAARSRYSQDNEDGRAQRYPRLLFTLREVSILTPTEADATLRTLMRAHPADRGSASSPAEAVAHACGPLKVLQRAWQRRNQAAPARRHCLGFSGSDKAEDVGSAADSDDARPA